jgi:hypothetical protein
MDIIARKDALAQELTHYFTGKPCKHGHICLRYAKTANCTKCLYERAQRPEEKAKLALAMQCKKRKAARKARQAAYYIKTKKPLTRIFHETPIHSKIASNLRNRINLALYGKNKSASSQDLVGCSIVKLFEHLETQFADGMTWQNHGRHGWHVDHIRPCASFDLTDPEQQRQCFHYTNLQPLWAIDNIRKGSKWNGR